MNIEAMKEEIKKEEGYSNKVYFDILGYGTIGYGHLVTPLDNFKEGKIYDQKELEKVFEYDFQIAHQDGLKLTEGLDLNEEAVEIIIHMCFQMGRTKVTKFKKMFKYLKEKDYVNAGFEMEDSVWAKKHTPARAMRLSERMKKLT